MHSDNDELSGWTGPVFSLCSNWQSSCSCFVHGCSRFRHCSNFPSIAFCVIIRPNFCNHSIREKWKRAVRVFQLYLSRCDCWPSCYKFEFRSLYCRFRCDRFGYFNKFRCCNNCCRRPLSISRARFHTCDKPVELFPCANSSFNCSWCSECGRKFFALHFLRHFRK